MVDLNRRGELREAIELLYFGYRAFTDGPDRILERRGLGRVHHRILYFVGGNPDISVKGLLALLAVSKQAINAPLRQLTEMKLIDAWADETDRRVKHLRLTEAGRKLEAELTGAQTRLLEAAFGSVGSEEEAGWRAVMRRLAPGD
jgi:DNA-binding MarR family transcriptional regulator